MLYVHIALHDLCKSSQHRGCFWVDIIILTNAVEYSWYYEANDIEKKKFIEPCFGWLLTCLWDCTNQNSDLKDIVELFSLVSMIAVSIWKSESLVIFGPCEFVLVASRRSSEELIFEGRVTVNGSVCNTPQVSFVISCLLIGFSPPCRDGFRIQV